MSSFWSLVAPKVVILTTTYAANDNSLVKMTISMMVVFFYGISDINHFIWGTYCGNVQTDPDVFYYELVQLWTSFKEAVMNERQIMLILRMAFEGDKMYTFKDLI